MPRTPPVMFQCTTCGVEYPTNVAECPECAPEDGPVSHCERCGEDFRGGDSCPACGALQVSVACDHHSDREAVGRCVVCGRAICEACGTPDRHAHLCQDHAAVPVIEGWAQVYGATTEFEAQLLRDNLRAEGVEARIYSQRDHILSVDLGELSIVRLLVPTWEFERAREVIREHTDPEGEVVFACASCGEAFDPGARECTGCGAPLA